MNLTTNWLGLSLKNPFVPSASPLSRDLDSARELQDAGASAIIMHSLFEEAIRAEEEGMSPFLQQQFTGHAEADSYLPAHQDFPGELDRYLEQIAALKATVDIPVVASLNGVTAAGWMQHAREIQDAGADALELNTYYIAGDILEEGGDVEERYVTLLQALREQITIPINMKLSPYFSSVGNMVKKLESRGVAGVSLFNRFYQPDINVDRLRLQHSLTPTRSSDTLLSMRWIAILYGRVGCSLGATSGVRNAEDSLKMLLAGADVVHLCYALLEKGPAYLAKIIDDAHDWMEVHGFETLDDFRGRLSQKESTDPAQYERLNYIRVLDNFTPPDSIWR